MCNVTNSYVSFKVIVALTRKVINIVKDWKIEISATERVHLWVKTARKLVIGVIEAYLKNLAKTRKVRGVMAGKNKASVLVAMVHGWEKTARKLARNAKIDLMERNFYFLENNF